MTATAAPVWHVLLIGIDAYQGGAPALSGCVNDVDAIQRLLIERLGVPPARIRRHVAASNDQIARPTEVASQPATYAALTAALAAIAAGVKADERVFIYYSGHGTQRFVKTADGKRYFREALVPHDNVVVQQGVERERLIFDWEMNAYLATIAAQTSLVTVILDCCCGAGTTRDAGTRKARFAPRRAQELELAAVPLAPGGLATSAGSVDRCMVVAACLDDEVARESERDPDDGPAHGELTRALLAPLAAIEDVAQLAALTWADIWRTIFDGVRTRNPYQTPWMSSHVGRGLFCGAPTEGDVGYTITPDGTGYRIGAGSLAGVTKGAQLAVYPPLRELPRFPPLGSAADRAARKGLLVVTEAQRSSSHAESVAGGVPPPREGLRGRMIAPVARLRVSLSPHDEALAQRIGASRLIEVVPSDGELVLLRTDTGDRELTDDVFGPDPTRGHEVLAIVPASLLATPPPATGRDPVVAIIDHYVAYSAPIRLAKACTDLPRGLQLRLLRCPGVPNPIPAAAAEDIVLPELQPERAPDYRLRAGHDLFVVELENVSSVDLWVTVLLCQNTGAVERYASKIAVAARSRVRAWYGTQKGQGVTTILAPGVGRGVDRIVAIGTTDRDATLAYLETPDTFRGEAKGLRGTRSAEPPHQWTSAMAVLHSTI